MEVATVSYNGSGTFNINTTGQPVVAGTIISASAFNSLTTDLATGLTTAITKDGQTTTTARITFAQGVTSSLVTDSSSISTGSIITDGGVGIAKNLYVGGLLNVAGATSFTNPTINNIKMGYSTTATAAGTTTLTISSNYRQFFTGTLAQTIVLPVTSTLVTGIAYEIENNSTGLLTVNSSGGNLVGTIPAGVCAHAVCIGTTLTTAADWDWDYISTTTITGTGANVLGTSPTITSPTLVTPALGTPASGVMTNVTGINYDGFKNRIINGAMVIDQRNAGASVTLNNNEQYITDRFIVRATNSTSSTAIRSTTVPSGFKNSLLITIGTGATAAGTNYIAQKIEGLNVYDLNWGSASAATVTLSFWVRSSLTGTFGGALQNNAGNRSYPFTYTISLANTFEQKSITIAGDQSGTWLTDTSTGIALIISLGEPAGNLGTAGAWAGADYRGATGQTNLVATSSATLYITGVQLEKGSTATSFDYRPYGTELNLCYRYYQKLGDLGWSTSTAYAANRVLFCIPLPVATRATPTVTGSATGGTYFYAGAAQSTTATAYSGQSTNGMIQCDFTVSATYLSVGVMSISAGVQISAEL